MIWEGKENLYVKSYIFEWLDVGPNKWGSNYSPESSKRTPNYNLYTKLNKGKEPCGKFFNIPVWFLGNFYYLKPTSIKLNIN